MQLGQSPDNAIRQKDLRAALNSVDPAEEGGNAYAMVETLYPICRSITGNGFRESLRVLQGAVALEMHEVPSGTPVFDWTVPKEWNIRDAYIKDAGGNRVVDFKRCNLHVLNYSVPVKETMSLEKLAPHLFTLP